MTEIVAAVATSLGVIAFAVVFTVLYRGYSASMLRELNAGKHDIPLMDDYIYGCRRSVKRRRRVGGIIKSVILYLLLALLIPVLAFSFLNKLSGNATMLGGRTVMVVASGSMSEEHEDNDYLREDDLIKVRGFNTYDIIVLEKVEEPALYDVIAFVNDQGVNVIHRIIGFNADGSYLTRGDSNNKSDTYHPTQKDVIGRYTGTRIPFVGSFVMFLQSIGGIVTLAVLIYCLLMLDRNNARIRDAEQKRLDYLLQSIELDLEGSERLHAEFHETLYYKGFAYRFDETGFLGKDEIQDGSYLEKSNSAAIRVIDSDGARTETEVAINFEEGDE